MNDSPADATADIFTCLNLGAAGVIIWAQKILSSQLIGAKVKIRWGFMSDLWKLQVWKWWAICELVI